MENSSAGQSVEMKCSEVLKRRALFYVFDGGKGIGHLRRLARIADSMKNRFACLIVTGHSIEPQWMVPSKCEYVRLPGWDSLIKSKAEYWGRSPFLDVSVREATDFRRSIIHGVMQGFRPDVLIVDHLPLGAHEELAPILTESNCRKYLVTRGIQNETMDLQRLLLGDSALESLKRDYDCIFSAIDPRVFDFKAHYSLPPEVADKTTSVGYVAPQRGAVIREETRALFGIPTQALWVVASAGGGQFGERLVEECLSLGPRHPDVYFDIVMGPRSRFDRGTQGEVSRMRLHSMSADLEAMHASADVVVTSGGYNSLLEAVQGAARIVCIPSQTDARDEPLQHASRLRKFVDLRVSAEVNRLSELLGEAISDCRSGAPSDRRHQLNVQGAATIAEMIYCDLEAR